MTDMPERIYADPPSVFDGCDMWRDEAGGNAVCYIRADLHAARETALQADADAARKAAAGNFARAEAAEAQVAKLVEVVNRMECAWANAIDLDIIASGHRTTAGLLRDECRAALSAVKREVL